MARIPLEKRKRFEVFKRDNFTCRYCGSHPPDVILVVDHVTPVKLGGGNEESNLVTACQGCNQGKAARPLGDILSPVDADVLYLERMQEIAELERFAEATATMVKQRNKTIKLLHAEWDAVFLGDWRPAKHILVALLNRFDANAVLDAILATGAKLQAGSLSDKGFIPYMWGVCKRIENELAGDEA